MNHIVDTCPLTKFEGGLNLLHLVANADGEVFDAQCLFQASLGEGEIYPQTYNFLPKWLPNCVLLIFFFGRDNELKLYDGNFLYNEQ